MKKYIIALTENDRELRGLMKLIKQKGAVLTRYCSMALSYFAQTGKVMHIADVAMQDGERGACINIYMEDEVAEKIEKMRKACHYTQKSGFVRIVLIKSLGIVSEEEARLESEFELAQKLAEIQGGIDTAPKDHDSVTGERRIIRSKKTEEEKDTSVKTSEKTESYDESKSSRREDPNPEKEKPNPDIALLDNFFPGLMQDISGWD